MRGTLVALIVSCSCSPSLDEGTAKVLVLEYEGDAPVECKTPFSVRGGVFIAPGEELDVVALGPCFHRLRGVKLIDSKCRSWSGAHCTEVTLTTHPPRSRMEGETIVVQCGTSDPQVTAVEPVQGAAVVAYRNHLKWSEELAGLPESCLTPPEVRAKTLRVKRVGGAWRTDR